MWTPSPGNDHAIHPYRQNQCPQHPFAIEKIAQSATIRLDNLSHGVQPTHAKRLRLILTALNQAGRIQDLNLPGLRLHLLRGNRRGYWAVRVSGNWRVVFRFDDCDIFDVELVDYH